MGNAAEVPGPRDPAQLTCLAGGQAPAQGREEAAPAWRQTWFPGLAGLWHAHEKGAARSHRNRLLLRQSGSHTRKGGVRSWDRAHHEGLPSSLQHGPLPVCCAQTRHLLRGNGARGEKGPTGSLYPDVRLAVYVYQANYYYCDCRNVPPAKILGHEVTPQLPDICSIFSLRTLVNYADHIL